MVVCDDHANLKNEVNLKNELNNHTKYLRNNTKEIRQPESPISTTAFFRRIPHYKIASIHLFCLLN